MRFAWDENKNRLNRVKHGLSFETAELIFSDRSAIIEPDRVVGGEQRWMAIGMAGNLLILAVCHTQRESDDEEIIRIISARKATSHERKKYYAQCGA